MESGSIIVQPMKLGPRGLLRTIICHPGRVVSAGLMLLAAYTTFFINVDDRPWEENPMETIIGRKRGFNQSRWDSAEIQAHIPLDVYYTADDSTEAADKDYVEDDDEGVGLMRRGGETVFYLNRLGRATMRVLQEPFLQEGPSRKIYHNLLDVKPPPYLPNYKAPCWVETLNTATPYNRSQFNRLEAYKSTMRYMEAVFRVRLRRRERWRLRCLPYFYIAGLAKCGTSELYTRLRMHPNITTGPMKEPHYWTRWRMGWMPPGYVPIHDYADMYDHAAQDIQERVILHQDGTKLHPMFFGDGSVTTLLENDLFYKLPENADHEGAPKFTTAQYIHRMTPQARIIAILRNPIDRLYSDYLFFSTLKKNRHTPPSPGNFHRRVTDAIEIMTECIRDRGSIDKCVYDAQLREEMMHLNLRTGMYATYVRPWLEEWPREQLLFLRLEDFKQDGRINVVNKVLHFLGEDDLPDYVVREMENEELRNTRSGDLMKVGPMLNMTREVLERFYGPYNRHLADILQNDRFLWQ